MSTADPDNALHSTAPSNSNVPAAERARSVTVRRTRVAGTLLIIACLLAVTGAFLPWLTVVSASLSSGLVTRLLTWHVWNVGCGLQKWARKPLVLSQGMNGPLPL